MMPDYFRTYQDCESIMRTTNNTVTEQTGLFTSSGTKARETFDEKLMQTAAAILVKISVAAETVVDAEVKQ